MASSGGQPSIHITSDPDTTRVEQPQTGGAREAASFPLRLLLVADLVPHRQADPSGPSRLLSVDRHSFSETMQRLAPRLMLDVPNRIGETPRLVEVELTFRAINDFRPDRVVRQVPALARLVDVREVVRQVKAQALGLDAFRGRMQEIGVGEEWAAELYDALTGAEKRTPHAPPSRTSQPAERAAPSDDPLDRLLGMVDGGEEQPETKPEEEPEPPGLMEVLVDAAAGRSPRQPQAQGTAAERLLADLDDKITRQLNAVLTHPDLRRLEAAWRGLKFLVDRIDFREEIALEVLPVPKDDIDEALYHQVLLPEHDGTDKAPLSAIVLDVAFTNSREDVNLLGELASTAASLQVPLIGSVAPAFFGLEQETGLRRLPLLGQHLEGPQYIGWKKLREMDEAQHLTLVIPRFLLRYPYGADHPVEDFSYQEEGHLWGSGALIVGLAVADSFAQTGSASHVRGRAVEDLPLWESPQGPAPLATLLPAEKQREVADAGFAVISVRRDAAIIAYAPTVKRPALMEDAEATREARVHASLPCQLFVARAAHLLLLLEHDVADGMPVDEARTLIAERFRRWLGTSGEEAEEAVQVEHIAEAQTPDHEVLAVRLQPPRHVLDDTVRLVLAARVPRHVRQTDDERTSA